METIEERAKECVRHLTQGWVLEAAGDQLEALFIAGAESEHELLTRWNDPKEELPELNHMVLTKWKYKKYRGSDIIFVGRFNGEEWGSHAILAPELFSIIGWREIHE